MKTGSTNKRSGEGLPCSDLFSICEGISGMWHYHLHRNGTPEKALCGARTMSTSLPMSTWGHKSDHIPESYCEECEKMYQENVSYGPKC